MSESEEKHKDLYHPDPTEFLSDKDKKLIKHWMDITEDLPVDYVREPSMYERAINIVPNWYNNLCEAKYEYDLQVFLGERNPWWKFWGKPQPRS